MTGDSRTVVLAGNGVLESLSMSTLQLLVDWLVYFSSTSTEGMHGQALGTGERLQLLDVLTHYTLESYTLSIKRNQI